jgi:cyclohexadienyl dehydratase
MLTALAAPAAWSQTAPPSRLDAVLAAGVLRVGSTGDYRPFTYLDPETKSFEGIDIDMAASLAKALGVRLEIVKTSWPSLMADLLADKFDLAMGGISISLERQKKALYSLPYLVDGKTPITRCADVDKYREIAQIDRPGVRVITNPGGTNERFAREHLSHAAIVVHDDNVTIFDQIAEGKADLMVTDASEILLQQKLHRGSLCAIHPETPFNRFEKAYLLPRDFALKAFVDQWLHQAQLTKEYDKIADRWLN